LPPEPAPLQEGQEQEEDNSGAIKGHWDKRLTSFQKVMFVKVFKEEKQCFWITTNLLIK
jgi:dynein heavy chain